MRRFFVLFIIIVGICSLKAVYAEDVSLGVATNVPINEKDVPDGAIIASSATGFIFSSRPYDPLIFGVVTKKPAVSFGNEQATTVPVLSAGQAYVLVGNTNGNIKKGDIVTSSATPGVGMKATKSGYIVGSALEDVSFKNAKDIKPVLVSLNVHFFTTKSTIQGHLLDLFSFSSLAFSDEPLTVFKYVMAVLVAVLSFALGVFTFGKIATNGIEALGRNPLAAKMIQLGIIFNVVITVIIVAGGLMVSIFILRL